MSNLKAPHIQRYIDWLRQIDYGYVGNCTSYDEKTYELLDELYLELRKIAPMGDPIQIRLRGYELTIRREDAGKITLKEVQV